MYLNPTPETLRFEIGAERFEVPSGKACEVPRRLAYVIAARGLPLVRDGAGEAEEVESTDARAPTPRLPPGVENVAGDPDEEEEGDDDEGGGEDVDKALAAQGVAAPRKRGRSK